jgi:regulator of PEP synthase PpsR (kinase-PPPase family)
MLGNSNIIFHFHACSENTGEIAERVWKKFSSVFSETAANYEAFYQMRIKFLNLNIKMTRQKKNLKTISVHEKNTDLIMKMIKKAKIFCVRVPLIFVLYKSLKGPFRQMRFAWKQYGSIGQG